VLLRARVRVLSTRRSADFCCVCTRDAMQSDTYRIATAHAWCCPSTRRCSTDGNFDTQNTEAVQLRENEKISHRAPCTCNSVVVARCVALRCDESCSCACACAVTIRLPLDPLTARST